MSRAVSRWPALPGLCLDCRTALAAGESCAPGHRAIDPGDPAGAEALRTALWGDASRRRSAEQDAQRTRERPLLVRALGVAGMIAVAAALVVPGPALLIAPLVASAAAAVFLGALSLGRARRWLREGAEPRLLLPAAGARADPEPPPADEPIYQGTVCDGARSRTPPFGGRPVYAYAVWLWRGDQLLLREAVALELEIETDDGTRVRIPPGRCRIEPAPAAPARRRLSWALQRYAAHRLGSRQEPAYPLLPADRAVTAGIAAGDRIELRVETEPRPDPRAPAGDYRAAPRALLVGRGTAVIGIVHPPTRPLDR